jgi:hypothetical protein
MALAQGQIRGHAQDFAQTAANTIALHRTAGLFGDGEADTRLLLITLARAALQRESARKHARAFGRS